MNKWLCVCGHKNLFTAYICLQCGRTVQDSEEDDDSPSIIGNPFSDFQNSDPNIPDIPDIPSTPDPSPPDFGGSDMGFGGGGSSGDF